MYVTIIENRGHEFERDQGRIQESWEEEREGGN